MNHPDTLWRRAALTLLGLVVAVLATCLGSVPAHATDNGAWSVAPTPPDAENPAPRNYFVLEGEPGTKIKDKVRIQNWTKAPITFKLFGADGFNTEQDGFFSLKGYDEKMTDLGRWVTPATSQVTVYGRTQVDVPVTVKIPRNATPGDHVGGVVAMNVSVESTQKDAEGVEVGIQRAVGARMYIRVAGPTTPALEVENVTLTHDRGMMPWTGSGRGSVGYTVKNTGNVRLSPDAVVTLAGLTGEIASVDGKGLTDLLPGETARVNQKVEGIPSFGKVTATVAVTTTDGPTDEAATSTWLVPWPALLVFLALIAVAIWLVRRNRGTGGRRVATAEEAPQLTVSGRP